MCCRVKKKKGLLIAYHVLHDDGAETMNYARFAQFIKHLPSVSVSASPPSCFMSIMSERSGLRDMTNAVWGCTESEELPLPFHVSSP